MSILCKFCDSKRIVKNGIIKKKQRYKCKECLRSFRVGDDREKYEEIERLKVIKLYLENVGIRSIERLTGISSRMIIYWIRKFSNLIKDNFNKNLSNLKKEDIKILEIDEMFTYLKKSQKMEGEQFLYGLHLTEKKTKLLILK